MRATAQPPLDFALLPNLYPRPLHLFLERNAPKWNHFGEAIPLQFIDNDQLL